MFATNVCSFPTTHGHTGTLKLDAKGPDDPRGRSQEVAAESAAEEDVRSLGDVPDDEMEAHDDYDEMMKKRDDSSTTNWFKCGDTSRWRPMDFPLVVSVLVRHKEDAV